MITLHTSNKYELYGSMEYKVGNWFPKWMTATQPVKKIGRSE